MTDSVYRVAPAQSTVSLVSDEICLSESSLQDGIEFLGNFRSIGIEPGSCTGCSGPHPVDAQGWVHHEP